MNEEEEEEGRLELLLLLLCPSRLFFVPFLCVLVASFFCWFLVIYLVLQISVFLGNYQNELVLLRGLLSAD